MSHTGIRLRITAAGQTLLEGDSDWLHMNAAIGAGLELPSIPDIMAGKQPEYAWYQAGVIFGAPVEIWVQACILSDTYPDDEEDLGEDG